MDALSFVIASVVNPGRDLIDWATLGFALFTALGTVGAVALALFLPRFEERRTRPRLTLSPEPDEPVSLSQGDDVVRIGLRVHNAPGRQTAVDVEVHVIAWLEGEQGIRAVARDFPLRVQGATDGATTANVHAGYSRTFAFAQLREFFDPNKAVQSAPLGFFDIVPRDRMHETVMRLRQRYVTYIVVMGSNFDAVAFRGVLGLSADDASEPDEVTATMAWAEPLQPVGQVPDLVYEMG